MASQEVAIGKLDEMDGQPIALGNAPLIKVALDTTVDTNVAASTHGSIETKTMFTPRFRPTWSPGIKQMITSCGGSFIYVVKAKSGPVIRVLWDGGAKVLLKGGFTGTIVDMVAKEQAEAPHGGHFMTVAAVDADGQLLVHHVVPPGGNTEEQPPQTVLTMRATLPTVASGSPFRVAWSAAGRSTIGMCGGGSGTAYICNLGYTFKMAQNALINPNPNPNPFIGDLTQPTNPLERIIAAGSEFKIILQVAPAVGGVGATAMGFGWLGQPPSEEVVAVGFTDGHIEVSKVVHDKWMGAVDIGPAAKVVGGTGSPIEDLKFCRAPGGDVDEALLALSNRSIAVIECRGWTAVQTIAFSAIYPTYGLGSLHLGVDPGSHFVVAAERNCGSLYALRLEKGPAGGSAVRCSSLTPFPLKTAALGMVVSGGGCKAAATESLMGGDGDGAEPTSGGVLLSSFRLDTISGTGVDVGTYEFEVAPTAWGEAAVAEIDNAAAAPPAAAAAAATTKVAAEDAKLALQALLEDASQRDTQTIESELDGLSPNGTAALLDALATQEGSPTSAGADSSASPSPPADAEKSHLMGLLSQAAGGGAQEAPVATTPTPPPSAAEAPASAPLPLPAAEPTVPVSPEPLSMAEQIMGVATGRPGGRKSSSKPKPAPRPSTSRPDAAASGAAAPNAAVDALLAIAQQQHQDIATLVEQVRSQQKQISLLKTDLGRSEFAIVSQVKAAVTDGLAGCIAEFKQARREAEAVEAEKIKRLMSAVQQSVFESVDSIVREGVTAVIEETVLPQLKAAAGGGGGGGGDLIQQISPALSQGFNALNKSLHDHANKVVTSKDVAAVLGTSVAKSVRQPVAEAVTRTFEAKLIPAVEASCQAMFQQTNAAMLRGADEHAKAVGPTLRSAAEQLGHVGAALGRQVGMLGQQMQMLQARADESARRDAQTQAALQGLREAVGGGGHVATAPPTAAAAPVAAPQPVDPVVLVQQGKFQDAFMAALREQKLEVLVRVCSAVAPEALFASDPPAVSQPVVLSLIQQLASKLEASTDLKIRYLKEAVMALDSESGEVKRFIPSVLAEVLSKVSGLLESPALPRAAKKNLLVLQTIVKGVAA